MQPRHRSSPELAHEREVLEDMLRSEGWRVFVQRVADEWKGDGYHARMGAALQDTADPLSPRVIHRTSIEMERMCQWPVTRVRDLKGSAE